MSIKKRKLESSLPLKQKLAALLMVERELGDEANQKSLEQISNELGISLKTLYNWRTSNKDFIAYVNILSDEFFESKRSIVYRQLMKMIESNQPSIKAIDLYLRRHGLLTDRTVVENSDHESGGKSNDDIEKEIAELDHLINELES